MKHRFKWSVLLSLSLALAVQGCSNKGGNPDLFIMEELDTASNVGDPEKRIERLEIFVKGHRDHPVRVMAYKRIMETMAVDDNDPDGALAYFDAIMERETDPSIRGELYFRRFEYLWDVSREEAVALAAGLIDGEESDYKLFLYLGYYLMGEKGREELAGRCFEKLVAMDEAPFKIMHARSVYGEFLAAQGRMDEAFDVLSAAGDYPLANEILAARYWEAGKQDDAIECYIRYAAGVPGALRHVKLDSLYSIACPGAEDLAGRILEKRVFDEGTLPDMDFSDLGGRTHRLSDYRGRKLVISSWSPT